MYLNPRLTHARTHTRTHARMCTHTQTSCTDITLCTATSDNIICDRLCENSCDRFASFTHLHKNSCKVMIVQQIFDFFVPK